MKQYLDTFLAIQSENGRKLLAKNGLVCKVGTYGGSVVLKLQKPSWTNDPMDVVQNKTGIFFAIWLSNKGIEQSCMFYNVHALKLRLLKGYRVKHGGDFAKSFREQFRGCSDAWSHMRIDYGPCTLMGGWIELNAATLKADTLGLMDHFGELCPTIDALLESCKTKQCTMSSSKSSG